MQGQVQPPCPRALRPKALLVAPEVEPHVFEGLRPRGGPDQLVESKARTSEGRHRMVETLLDGRTTETDDREIVNIHPSDGACGRHARGDPTVLN